MSATVAIWIVLLSILVNAFFAGVETALTTSRRVRILHRARRGDRGASAAARLLRRRESSIVGAVIGNNVAIVTGTSIATAQCVAWFPESGEQVAAVFMSASNIVFGEVIPKSLFRAHPERLLAGSARPFRWLMWVLAPAQWLATVLARALLWLLRLERRREAGEGSRDELIRLFTASSTRETISDQQGRFLHQLARNSQISVRQIMTPLDQVSRVLEGGAVRDVLDCVRQTGHSRIPVVDPDGDITGLLLFRDLVRMPADEPIDALVREVLRVSSDMALDEAISTLIDARVGLAVVTDGAGHAAGIVTLEDLFEPLVGEILDEHDRPRAA